MEITPTQFARIEHCPPRQRGNVSLTNLQVVNAMLYVAEHGRKWRGLPKRFGNWHTIYTRMRRWSKAGVLDKMFEELQREQVVRIKIEAVSLDSTSIKVHPDGTGALKKRPPVHWKVPRRMEHQDSYGCRECSNGRDILSLAGAGTRRARGQAVATQPGSDQQTGAPVDGPVPTKATKHANWRWILDSFRWRHPLSTRIDPWEYDREMYKRRNEVGRLFRHLKGYRRIFSRFEKLDTMFLAFFSFVLVADGLRSLR
jgi:transposase